MAANKTSKITSSTLPLELILEIFSRLPTKSLVLLRGIFDNDFPQLSKSLETLEFQHKHAFNVLNKPTNQQFLISSIIIHDIHPFLLKPSSPCQTSSFTRYNFRKLFKQILPNKSKIFYGCSVIGASNGLICLYFEYYRLLDKPKHRLCACCASRKTFHRLILWNPYTREHHSLPIPRGFYFNLFNNYISLPATICGFGYDVVNKTYKLVMGEGRVTQFYDLSTNEWRKVKAIGINWGGFRYLKSFYSRSSKPQFGHYVNGALNWIVSSTNVVSIDLSTEVSHLVKLPHCCSLPERSSNLGVFKGCLSVSCFQYYAKKLSMWVMKEYGKEESWTNILSIKLRKSDMSTGPADIMVIRPPLWVSQDEEEMLFLLQGKFASLCSKPQKPSYVKGMKFSYTSRGILHVDTLVSPKPEVYRMGALGLVTGKALVPK